MVLRGNKLQTCSLLQDGLIEDVLLSMVDRKQQVFLHYLMNRLTSMSNRLLKSMGILWDVLWCKAFLSLLASDFNVAG